MPRPFDLSQLDLMDPEIPRLLEVCAGAASALCFDDGEYLFEEEDRGSEIYIVLRGAFVVEHTDEQGNTEVIATQCIEDGELCFVGEMAYFGDGLRSASMHSSGATYALQLMPEHLDLILADFPLLTQVLCRQLSSRLKETNDLLKKVTAELALDTTPVELREGQVLIEQGQMPDKLYHLIFGDLSWELDGEPIAPRMVQEFIEPTAYFLNLPYPVTVRAKTASCLAAVNSASKEVVVRNYPGLVLKLFAQAVSES